MTRRRFEFSIEGNTPVGVLSADLVSDDLDDEITFSVVDEAVELGFDGRDWHVETYTEEGHEMQGQKTFEVEKSNLVDILKANKAKHVEKYKIASEKFREAVIEKMREHLAVAEGGGELKLQVHLREPTLHEDTYATIIGLLEMSTEEHIEITESDYCQYVKDEWNWSPAFQASTVAYLSKE